MSKVHVKGRLLQMLEEDGPQYDYELATRLAADYDEQATDYWHNDTRLTLADLSSGGLVYPIEDDDRIDLERTFGVEKLVRRYALSDFGRERMRASGLLRAAGKRG
jgi:hypothetical protein